MIEAVLKRAGVEFIDENGGGAGGPPAKAKVSREIGGRRRLKCFPMRTGSAEDRARMRVAIVANVTKAAAPQ